MHRIQEPTVQDSISTDVSAQSLNQSRNFPPQYRHVSKVSKSKLYLDLVSETDDNKDDGAPSSSRFTSGGGGGGGPKTSSLRNSVPHREQNLEMSGSGIARKVRPQRTVLELLVSTCLVYYGWNMDLFPWRDHRIFFKKRNRKRKILTKRMPIHALRLPRRVPLDSGIADTASFEHVAAGTIELACGLCSKGVWVWTR